MIKLDLESILEVFFTEIQLQITLIVKFLNQIYPQYIGMHVLYDGLQNKFSALGILSSHSLFVFIMMKQSQRNFFQKMGLSSVQRSRGCA